ncbi:hypothetical protein [Modestobacter caceresii]|uniref:hypothetical protein n=1 Tax=Modestobacter caceresii TaxID=1522368 RepID=UPI00068EBB2B|nr:hypothetical protein [Modestobacter caceresii]
MEDPALLMPRRLGTSLGTGPASGLLARAAATAAAACALVHLLAAPGAAGAGLTAVAVACLLCAVHLWRRGSTAAWLLHVVLTSVMLLHSTAGPGGHHHGADAVTGPAAWAGPVGGALALLALVLAAVHACWLPGPPPPQLGRQSAGGPPGIGSVRRVPQA